MLMKSGWKDRYKYQMIFSLTIKLVDEGEEIAFKRRKDNWKEKTIEKVLSSLKKEIDRRAEWGGADQLTELRKEETA